MRQIYLQPYEIFLDPSDKKEGAKSGIVIHKNRPQFKCRFELCDEMPEETGNGLSTYNVDTGVFLSDLELLGSERLSSMKEISNAMKEAARVVDQTLRLDT